MSNDVSGIMAANKKARYGHANRLSLASGKDWMIYRDPLGQLHFVTESPATVHREGRVDVWLPEATIEALIAEASMKGHRVTELREAGNGGKDHNG